MRRIIKKITPLILLFAYSIIAGGSLTDMLINFGIIIGIIIALFVLGLIIVNIESHIESKKGLKECVAVFGEYTDKIEYETGKYILYDESTHRILLRNSVYDSRKIRELKITKKTPQKKIISYNQETTTKTSTGSMAGRAIAGGLIAGPIGALIGGATAKQKSETKSTPVYKTTMGFYIIEVIDTNGEIRATYSFGGERMQDEVINFFQRIIEKNLEPERISKQIQIEKNKKNILEIDVSAITVGKKLDFIETLTIDSKSIKEEDGEIYELCPDVIERINIGWGVRFERITIKIKNGILCHFLGISHGYIVVNFNEFISDTDKIANYIVSQEGEPSAKRMDISYSEFTEDNNRILGYVWNNSLVNIIKISYVYEKGKYRYEFSSEKL